MDDLQTQVDAFVALPRAERREKYPSLPKALKLRVRKAIEARRGIARREDGGVMVLTKEAYLKQLLRLQDKRLELPKRIEKLDQRLVDLKRQVQENYGDEALAEVENALEQAVSNNE